MSVSCSSAAAVSPAAGRRSSVHMWAGLSETRSSGSRRDPDYTYRRSMPAGARVTESGAPWLGRTNCVPGLRLSKSSPI